MDTDFEASPLKTRTHTFIQPEKLLLGLLNCEYLTLYSVVIHQLNLRHADLQVLPNVFTSAPHRSSPAQTPNRLILFML